MKHRLLGVLLASAFVFPAGADEAGKPSFVHVKKAAFHLFTFHVTGKRDITRRQVDALSFA